MSCESRITDLRARIPRQQDLNRTRRTEKQRLEEDARRLRAEADSAAIRGQAGMQLGMGNNSRRLLEQAERKMREAMTKEKEASDLEKLALDGERNIGRLCDQLLVNGRQRGDVENERKREEARVDEVATQLDRYKREIAKCLTEARNLRAEEGLMKREARDKAEQAERLEREAQALDQEAATLEREFKIQESHNQ